MWAPGDIIWFFVLKCCMLGSQNLSGNVLGAWDSDIPPPSHGTHQCWDRCSSCVRYTTCIDCMQSLFCVCKSSLVFHLQVKPAATCLHLLHPVSYTNIKHWQIVACKINFMKVKLHIALNNEIFIPTQLVYALTNHVKSGIPTQIFALLPVEWEKICLLFFIYKEHCKLYWAL